VPPGLEQGPDVLTHREKRSSAVDFYLYLAAAFVTLRMLIRRSTTRYRWDHRPTTRRLK
jgi:hypothetical protein